MKKIVIVEDEVLARQGLSKLISKLSSEFVVIGEAENGYEGLKLIQSTEPDIVITDINMPKMNGLNMIEELIKIGINCTFIILSGYAEFEYAKRGIRLGVTEYLLKPISVDNVKNMLDNLICKKYNDIKYSDVEYSITIEDMIECIKENYSKKIGLNTFADKYKLTPEYLSNLFNKETGITFSNFLKEVRLNEAKNLILNTDLKIYEIAYKVGYPDQKYFSKVFKEYVGVSPKQYALNINKK